MEKYLTHLPIADNVFAVLKEEFYLHENDFQKIFHLNKEEFYKLPGWKQKAHKQSTMLF